MGKRTTDKAGDGEANVTASRARLAIRYVATGRLVPYARNARTHSEAQVTELVRLIDRFGFTNPVLVDEKREIIAGHGRVMAAKRLDLAEVPTITISGLSDAQKRALRLADNRVALNSGWDAELLRTEIEALGEADEDVLGLGFGQKEIDDLLGDEDDIPVEEIATGPVEDRFWISIRGPLVDQAKALQKLEAVMADLVEVEVELGTIAVDGI